MESIPNTKLKRKMIHRVSRVLSIFAIIWFKQWKYDSKNEDISKVISKVNKKGRLAPELNKAIIQKEV